MAKKPANHRKGWSSTEVKTLRELAKGNTPTRVIGLKLKRTPAAVQQQASAHRISLGPPNQKPYNRRKKG